MKATQTQPRYNVWSAGDLLGQENDYATANNVAQQKSATETGGQMVSVYDNVDDKIVTQFVDGKCVFSE